VLVDEVFTPGANDQAVSEEVLWLLADHQNTVRDIASSGGTLRKHIDYDSFGRVTGSQTLNGSTVDQLFYFQGQERDSTTGLQKHGARWYDPNTGRWLSEDPLGFDAGDPNLYRFVGNGPDNGTDSTGTTQTGNPLNNLFAGGYSGNKVAKAKLPIPAVNPTLSLGTLGKVLGNSVINAAPSYLSPTGRAALNAGVTLVGAGLTLQPPQYAPPQSERPTFGSVFLDANKKAFDTFRGAARSVDNYISDVAIGTTIRTDERTRNLRNSAFQPTRSIGEAINTSVSGTAGFVRDTAYQANLPVRIEDNYRGYVGQGVNSRTAIALSFGEVAPFFSQTMTANELYSGQGNRPGNLARVLTVDEQFGNMNRLIFDASMTAVSIQTPRNFSNPKIGQQVHGQFEKALIEQTGTSKGDWIIRTKPGQTGVDATYQGTKPRFPTRRAQTSQPQWPERIQRPSGPLEAERQHRSP
jgi:RHS repeat-associated protein